MTIHPAGLAALSRALERLRDPDARDPLPERAAIDTLRGIACILLVFYHVVGLDAGAGLRVPADSLYRVVNDALTHVRMPLFTFLSGMVYALRPVVRGQEARFLRGKVRRLVLPFVCVGPLFAIVQALVPGSNMKLAWGDMARILILPHAHFWFIAALFLTFVAVGLLDRCRALETPLRLAIVFFVSCLLFRHHLGGMGLFAWNRALFLLPFFLAGLSLMRFGRWSSLALVALALSAMEPRIAFSIAAAAALCAVLPPIRPLARIGTYSYTIYLYHVFGTAGCRILMSHLGLTALPLLASAGLAAGLALPIALHLLLQRSRFLAPALLGVRGGVAASK